MGLFDRLRGAFSEKTRLLDELALIAGLHETGVERLRRHAPMAIYPDVAKQAAEVATREMAHQRALRTILAEHDLWPKAPESVPPEGVNNWERLSNDLAILLQSAQELNRHAYKWEGVDDDMVRKLAAMASEMSENETTLRKIVLKLDPHAID